MKLTDRILSLARLCGAVNQLTLPGVAMLAGLSLQMAVGAGVEPTARGMSPRFLPALAALSQTESFEGALPGYVSAEKGRVNVSSDRAQDGTHSLRWDWVPGDRLTFRTGTLGNIDLSTGYGGYSRSAFSISVFTDCLKNGALTFKWMAGDATGASFEVPLIFRGWQHLCYHYSWSSGLEHRNGKVLEQTDRIVVEAPKAGAGGTYYFDAIDFNKPVDYRVARKPITALWKPRDVAADCPDPALLAPPKPEELAAIAHLSTALAKSGTSKLSEATLTQVETNLSQTFGLSRIGDRQVVCSKSVPDAQKLTGEMHHLASLWISTDQPEAKARLENAYFLLDDYLRDLGAVPQGALNTMHSCMTWYGGRDHGDACFIMREPLRRTGRLERVRNSLKYAWNYDNQFSLPPQPRACGTDTDYLFIDSIYCLKIALMHDTTDEVVRHLRMVSRRFSADMDNLPEPDGSMYHHGFYNFPYISYTLPVVAGRLKLMSNTPFAVPQPAFEKIKRAALAMRYFCNLKDSPLSMHGRHPGQLPVTSSQYLDLAEAGRAYNAGKLDRDLAAAYLRLEPKAASDPKFTQEAITPEPAPQGNLAMNYGIFMGHRRGEWLAFVHGYSKFLPAYESYANANRHGLFMGNGGLDIFAAGNPINLVDSGCDVAHGWDWRHADGTTFFEAPYAKIANGNGTMSERSDVGCVGGLTHGGTNGIFTLPLHSGLQYLKALPDCPVVTDEDGSYARRNGRKPAAKAPGVPTKAIQKFFTANKTTFFFGDHILCLGSDIALPDSPYPVRTALFQKHLKNPQTAVFVDGNPIVTLPFETGVAQKTARTLMDTQNTGYCVPAGQRISVVRKHQKSRDGHDEKDTEGDYATAWLEHGVNPQGVGYEYAVLPCTTPDALAAFAAAPPYRVYRKDAKAHLVYDRTAKSWGCAVLAAGSDWIAPGAIVAGDPVLPLASADRACLVMMESLTGGNWKLSVTDPDLNLVKGISQPRRLTLTLNGTFQSTSASNGIAVHAEGTVTTVTVECVEGRGFSVELMSRK